MNRRSEEASSGSEAWGVGCGDEIVEREYEKRRRERWKVRKESGVWREKDRKWGVKNERIRVLAIR